MAAPQFLRTVLVLPVRDIEEATAWLRIPPYIGWLVRLTEDEALQQSLLSSDTPQYLDEFLQG